MQYRLEAIQERVNWIYYTVQPGKIAVPAFTLSLLTQNNAAAPTSNVIIPIGILLVPVQETDD